MIDLESITQVSQFMVDTFVSLWSAIGTWGVIGLGIIAPTVLYKVARLIKKTFTF